ncbi:unnamed protein product [Acanthosepion pharaonis]|uniref:Uncharacterized protein n=1 Tax=Acanthosepion pharaonis TaxID=158019 RepID=A0A812CUP5_ACAPH|nr:unnamed protein product [Sepia pharaonis]
MDNVDGFKELFNALTSVSHASSYPSILPSSHLSILKEMEQFQKLLLAVITHPPVFQIDRNSNGTMGSNYFYILRKLMLNWNNLQNNLVQNSYNANVRLLEKWLLTNSTDFSSLKTPIYSINKDLLVQYYALDFINKELTKIKETNGSWMIQFLSSFDVKNLLELMQSSPQSGRIVLETVIKLIEEPTKLLHLLDSNKWSVVCQNVSVFREMFALDTSKQAGNDTVLQSMFCKDVLQKVNFNKLLQDLQSNKDFQQMFTLVSDVLQSNLFLVNHTRISLSQFINAHITFQNIVNSLNWQKTLMLTNNTMVSQFLQHLKAEWSKYTNSRMLTGLPLVLPVIDKLWTNIYDFLPISFKWQHQQYYIQVLSSQKVLEFITLHLEQLNGTTDLKNYFQSPTITQFIDLLEQSPTLVDLLLSTFWQMIQQPQKISLWFQDNFDINRTVATVGSIGDVLKVMTGSNLPASLSQLISINDQSLLLQSYIMDFLNLHLTKINGTKNFVLLHYVNSSELSKLFKLLEEVPNAVKVLLHTILRWNQKPEEVQNLLNTVDWGQMCNNSALFNQIFATDILGSEKADFHGTICNRVLLHGDFSKLLSELNRNVEGFSTLYSSINQLYKTGYRPNEQRLLVHSSISIWKKISATKKFVLQDFLNSEDIKKLVALLEASPDVVSVFLNTILRWNQKPQEAEKLLSTVKWDQVCNNSAVFSQIFATNVLGNRAAQFQAKVCASVSFQEFFNRPWMEILSKIHGFQRYITLVDQLYNASFPLDAVKINFTEIFLNSAKYQSLIDSLIMNPPQLVIGTDNSWMNVSSYMKDTKKFLAAFENEQMNLENASLPTILATIGESLNMAFSEIPATVDPVLSEMKRQLLMESYWYTFINFHLEKISATKKFVLQDFLNSEDIKKLVALLEASPDVVSVFLNTILRWNQKPQEAEKLLSTVKWDQVCNNSAVFSQIFATNVLGSRAGQFQAKVCASVSFQEFFNRPWMEILSKIHGFQRYITLVDQLYNASFPLDAVEKLLSTVKWDQVCNNSAVFSQIFATDVLGSRAAQFQAKVCASVSFQEFFNRPWMETLSKIHGFQRYITLVDQLYNASFPLDAVKINFTKIFLNSAKYQSLIDSLIMNPPQLVIGTDNSWMNVSSYMKDIKMFIAAFENEQMSLENASLSTILATIGESLNMAFSDIPAGVDPVLSEMKRQLLMESYWYTFINFHLEKISATKKFVLQDFLNSQDIKKLIALLEESPDVVSVFLNTILRWNQKPQEVEKLLSTVKWDQVCNNSAVFSQIFATDVLGSRAAQFQAKVCASVSFQEFFNRPWMETLSKIHGFQRYITLVDQLYNASFPLDAVKINFTKIFLNQAKYLSLIDSLIMNPPQLVIGTDNSWMNVSSYMKDIKMFLAAFENEQRSLENASLSTILATIGESLNLAFSEIPAQVDPVLAEMKRQLLMESYWYTFINFHLEKISATKKFVLQDFLNSEDIKKLIALLEESPDVVSVFLNTILRWNQKPQEAEKLLSTVKWDQVCNNSAVFSQIFATDVFLSRAAQFQAKVCASVSFQEFFNRPWMETLSKIHGFQRYITLIDQLYNASFPLDAVKINFTKIFLNQAKYLSLIDSLIMNPPQLVIGTDNSWMNVSLYQGKINMFLKIIQLYYLDERLPFSQDLIKLITGLNKEMLPTGITTQLIHVNQNLVILHSLMELINPILKNVSQNQHINILDMANSAEMVQILSLLQVSPDSVEIFLKLAMKILQNPQRILPWLNLDQWKQLCHPSINGALMSSLFGNVSASQLPFAIKQIHSMLCSFLQQNVTLETFISQISPIPGFSKFYKMISTNTFTNMSVNSTALVAEVKQFQAYLMSLSANPPVLYWNLEKILPRNNSLLLNILDKYNKKILSSDTKSIVSRLKILDDLLSQHLPSAVISRFQMVKKYLLIQQSLMQLLNQPLKQINATGEFILMDAVKSQELKKIISLVLASPGMANLLLETSLQLLNDYQKISSISNPGTWQNICNNPQLLNKVFNQTVAAYYYVNLTQLQSRLCKEVNGTKLWIELQQNFDPSGQITHLLMPTRNVTIDYTAVADEVTLFYNLLMSLSSHKMLTFKVTKDDIWWSDNFNKLIESFVNTTKMQPIQFK